MYPVQHLVPNGFNINVVRLTARSSLGFYGPSSKNLSSVLVPRVFATSVVRISVFVPEGFYQSIGQNLAVSSRVVY